MDPNLTRVIMETLSCTLKCVPAAYKRAKNVMHDRRGLKEAVKEGLKEEVKCVCICLLSEGMDEITDYLYDAHG
ncbi:MAG: hypothetical protein DRN15_07145 [Thermoprotei archaeon]|nr:MAG: hypothetical protein DRN15_07145 [Thermoprotei archaeon]